jgi:hypothetical protein
MERMASFFVLSSGGSAAEDPLLMLALFEVVSKHALGDRSYRIGRFCAQSGMTQSFLRIVSSMDPLCSPAAIQTAAVLFVWNDPQTLVLVSPSSSSPASSSVSTMVTASDMLSVCHESFSQIDPASTVAALGILFGSETPISASLAEFALSPSSSSSSSLASLALSDVCVAAVQMASNREVQIAALHALGRMFSHREASVAERIFRTCFGTPNLVSFLFDSILKVRKTQLTPELRVAVYECLLGLCHHAFGIQLVFGFPAVVPSFFLDRDTEGELPAKRAKWDVVEAAMKVEQGEVLKRTVGVQEYYDLREYLRLGPVFRPTQSQAAVGDESAM